MRKILVGLLVVGLLAVAVATPAMAQAVSAGSGDPLGQIASGAVLPYFGDGASGAVPGFSLLELRSTPAPPRGRSRPRFRLPLVPRPPAVSSRRWQRGP